MRDLYDVVLGIIMIMMSLIFITFGIILNSIVQFILATMMLITAIFVLFKTVKA